MELWKDEEYLRKEFIDNRKTARTIAKELNINDSRIEYYLGKYKLYGIKGRVKHSVNINKFNISDPIFNYYAGLVATDGYIDLINNRVSIRIKNEGAKELLNNLKAYFEYSGEVRVYNSNYDLTITSKELITKLEDMKVTGYRKTYKLQFPNNFPNEDCERMFLRGVLDGDGNIKTSKTRGRGGQFRIVTASDLFIQGVINCINSRFNTHYEITTAKVNGREYPKLEMKVLDSLNLYKWLYVGYESYRLKDKHSKYLKTLP